MDSANLRQQEQLAGSSLGTSPTLHGVPNSHLWNQSFLLNGDNSESSMQTLKMFYPDFNGVLSSSRGLRQNQELLIQPPSSTPVYNLNTPMIPSLAFNWASNSENYPNHPNQELHFPKIKQEFTDSFPNYSGTVSDPAILEGLQLAVSAGYIKHEQDLQEFNEKLLLKSFSSDCQIGGFNNVYNNAQQSSVNFGGIATCSGGRWKGQDLSSVNMQALDLLDSAKFSGGLSHPSQNNLALFSERGILAMKQQEQNHRPPNIRQKMSSLVNEATETKRASSVTVSKAFETPPKKPRFETSSSFPPFKVRKEKLGDRITALQQLVAPFGKTDTASVLLEAIGYIKFLQDQVETLSVPYMKASGDSSSRTVRGAQLKESSSSQEEKKRDEEPRRDLRSRGLCLVPLSCTSHVTNDNGGAFWPPSNFGGGT